jgi:hypothetical protein
MPWSLPQRILYPGATVLAPIMAASNDFSRNM